MVPPVSDTFSCISLTLGVGKAGSRWGREGAGRRICFLGLPY